MKVNRSAVAAALFLVVVSVGCGLKIPPTFKLPPIVIVETPAQVSKPEPTPTPAPPVVEPQPIVVEPVPVIETPAPVVAEVKPFQNLNIVVQDSEGRAITGAKVAQTKSGESRVADGNGFVNFGVRDEVEIAVSAQGYFEKTVTRGPGDWIVKLDAPAKPKPPVEPAGNLGFAGCGRSGDTLTIPASCMSAVAKASKNYPKCGQGDPVACHRYVREVVLALRTTQNDPAWGLISKPRGSMACTMAACGRDVSDGYGEDMVAYLPKGNDPSKWTGVDIIVGAGAVGANHLTHDVLMPDAIGGRASDLWAAVPKQ